MHTSNILDNVCGKYSLTSNLKMFIAINYLNSLIPKNLEFLDVKIIVKGVEMNFYKRVGFAIAN